MLITLAGASTVVGFECVMPSTSVDFLSSVSTEESNDSMGWKNCGHSRPLQTYESAASRAWG